MKMQVEIQIQIETADTDTVSEKGAPSNIATITAMNIDTNTDT